MDREESFDRHLSQLVDNPTAVGPFKRLEHSAISDWGDVVWKLEERAEDAPDPMVSARLFLEAGRAALAYLEDREWSERLLEQAVDLAEDTELASEAQLVQLALEDDQETLLGFFTNALEESGSNDLRARLYLRMGFILEEIYSDYGEADNAYAYALELDASNQAAYWGRESIARSQQSWGHLAELLAEEIEVADDPDRQVEISVELGNLYRLQFEDEEAALECFSFAYELDPSNEAAKRGLVELDELDPSELEEDDEDVEEFDEADLEDDEDLQELDEADLEEDEEELGDDDVVELDEGDFGVEESPPASPPELDESDDEETDDVVELEDEEFVEEDEDVELEEDSEQEVAAEEEAPADGGEAVAEADLEEEADEADLEEGGDEDVDELDETDHEEEADEDDEELDEADLEEEADEDDEELDEADLEEEADEDDEELDEADLEEEAEEPDEAAAESEDLTWEERLEGYRDRAMSAGDDAETLDWLVDAARLEWLHRGDEADNVDLWRDAVEAGVAEDFYEQAHFLYFSSAFWEDIYELLEGEGGAPSLLARVALFHLGDEDRAEAHVETSGDEELEQALEDFEDAQDNWRRFQRAVDKRHSDLPEDEKAMTVYGYLADLGRGTGQEKKEVDALRRLDRQVDDEGIQERLMVCYRQAEKWPMYVDLVKEQAERFDEDRTEDRVEWLEEAVRVYRDEMSHDMMVVNTYKEILEIDPDNVGAVDSLVQLYDDMNRSSELINALQQKAELVEDPDEKIELYTRVADLFLDKFRNQAEAISAYESVLEIDPHHDAALEFLTEMYEKRREWEKLVDVRRRAVEGLESDDEKVDALKDVAELASDKLRKPDVATELWLQVRELAPADRDALDALEQLHEKARNYEELAEVVEQKVEQVDDPSEALDLYQKLGMLYSDRLEEPEPAMEAWQQALEIEPDNRKARKALERLYVDNRKWDDLEAFYADRDEHKELVRMMETLVGSEDNDEVKIEILLRAARVWRTDLEDLDRAKRNLERALDIDQHHEGVARELEPIYREEQNWDGLREVFEIVLDHQDEPEDRKPYQLQLAELHEDKLEDPSTAFDWYSQAFMESPGDSEIVDPLERVAGASDRWADVVNVYEGVLAETDDDEITEEIRLTLGRVLFDELERTDAAVEQFEAVLERDEENVEALAQMEKIHRAAERWDELMGVYRRRLELTDKDEDKVEILRGIAEIAELQKGDIPEAIERLNEALELGPENEKTLRELHRLYRVEEDHAQLADVLRTQIEIIEDRARERGEEQGAKEAVDPAEIVGEQAVDAEADEAAFEAELEDEEEPPADEIAEEESDVDELEADEGVDADDQGEAAEETLEESDDDEATAEEAEESTDVGDVPPRYTEDEVERLVDLRYELGAVLQDHLDEDEEAVDALARVLSWRPEHVDARDAVELYLDDADLRGRVATILEPIFAIHNQWERHIDVLEVQLEEVDEEDREIELLEQIGRVHLDEIGAPERSFDAWGRILPLRPDHERAREQLIRIAEGADLWQQLADRLEEISDEITDGELRRDYLFELGDIYADQLDAPSTAEAFYHEILDESDEAPEALDKLEVIYARTERWRDLLDVFDQKIELADDEAAVNLQFRKAVLWDQLLEQPHEAIDVLQGILDEDAENKQAVRALSRLYRKNEMWDQLADVVERELELAEPDEEHDVKKRLATIHHEHLGDDARAVDLLEEIIDENPEDARTVELLETMMELDASPSGRISRILEPLYQELEAWDPLIGALEVQVDEHDDPDGRVELLHRIASLHEERQGAIAEAFETMARALDDEVDNQETLDELYRLAEQLADWERLVDVFRAQADMEADPDVRRDLLRRAAAIYIERLETPADATPLLHEVLEIFPDDLETAEELEEIYRELEDWESLVDILRHRAAHLDEPEDRKDLLYQAGNIYDEILERPADAVDVYREVLEFEPFDNRAIDRLEELFTRLEWWEDLLEIYQKKLELADNDEARKDLYYAIAPIYEDQLDQPYEAIDTYRDILDVDPEELAALEEIADLYEQTEQWHELLEVLSDQKEIVSLPEERLSLHYEIGRLWETKLGDALQAVEVYREILDEDPDHEETREALAGMIERGEAEVEAAEVLYPIYEDAQEWESLVHVQKLLIEASHEPDRKLELYREVGDIYEDRLDDQVSAFETYLDALDVAPDRESLLDTIERLAAELDGWDVVIDRFDEVLAEEADFQVVFALNRRIGRILDEEVDDVPGAIERYEEALDIEPEHPEVTEALDVLYQETDEWEKLTDILQTRIYIVDNPEQQLELRSRMGLLYQNALEQPEKAVDTYQAILEDHPENEFAIESLEEMFMMGWAPDRTMGILEPWYVDRDRHEKLVDLYLQRLERIDDPIERFDLLKQVGELYLEELDQPGNALHVYGSALTEQPESEELAETLEGLAEETDAWDEAAGFYYDAIESGELSDSAAIQLWGNLARILDEEMDQIEDAETAYQQVLELDPGEPEALEALDRIYEEQGRWADLADILNQRLDNTYDEEVIVDVDFRLAQIYQHELDELDQAVDTYRNLLDIRPMYQEALSELEHIHREREEWDELFDVLERLADATEEVDEKIDSFAQMATLAEQMLDRPFDAIDLWNRVLELDPEHADALNELSRLYYEEERWDELVGIVERELELTEDPDEQLELYKSLGTVWGDELGNDGPALDAWRNVLEIDEHDYEALKAVRDLYTRQGDYEELAPVLERLIEHEETDEADELELWVELAEIRGEMLLDTDAAIEAWQQVVQVDSDHDRALDELEELYLQEARWEEAAQVLEIKSERIDDEVERIDLLSRIAEIWEHKLEQPDRATVFYEQILELDPSDMQASHSLEDIYRNQATPEAYQSLVGLYLDRAEVLEDRPFDRMEALRSASRVFEEELDNPVNALVVLVSAFNIDTYDDETLVSEIERLARETGEWGEVVEKYQAVIRELGDSPEAARLHEQVGDWYAEELEQPDDAIYHLRRALDIDPQRTEILESLQELYRELESWPELSQILQERIEQTADPDAEVELWRTLGELYELQMGEVQDAIDAYWQILEIDDADLLAIESLERIYEADERWEDLIDILQRKAESTYDPDDIVEIRIRIARTWEERLGDLERAIESYEELLAQEPDNEEALQALERLYFETEQWHELLEIYDQELDLTHEPDEQVEIHGQIASVLEDQLDQPHDAAESYNQILMVDPDNTTAMQNLERLYGQLEQWFDLVDILQQHIDLVEEADRKVELLNELARVQENQIDDSYAAVEAYERSLELEPDQPSVLFDLAELHRETSNWESAVDSYESLLELLEEPDDQIDIHFTVADLLEGRLNNDMGAEEHYQKALDLDPDHVEARAALEQLYDRNANWEKLVNLYKTAAEQTMDLTEKAQNLARAGAVYDVELDNRRRALDFYEEALEEDPKELEAAEPLIDLYLEKDEWERAVPLLDMVIEQYKQAAKLDRAALENRYVQLATVYEGLEQDAEALEQYWNAYDLDRDNVEVLLGLGRLLFEKEQYESAGDILTQIESEHQEALETDELLDLYYRLGTVRYESGEIEAAIDYFEEGISLDGYHEPTLEGLVEAHQEAGYWDSVVEFKRRLLELTDEEKVRFALLTDIGEICVDQLADMEQAIEAYLEGLEIKPESVAVLRKLLEIYKSTNQWHEAVNMLDRLIEQQEEPKRQAKFNYTAAIIQRDKIGDPEAAIEYFEKSLDADIKKLEAFEAVDRILTEMKEWKELERAYRRMLRRIAENDEVAMEEVKFKLWEGLGEIYRSRLGHPKSAIQAFNTATQLQPDNEKVRLILADLYEKTGENLEGVIDQHKALIEKDPFRIESYKALFRVYLQTNQYDRAWCVSAALTFLDKASDEEQRIYEQYRGQNLRKAKANLDQDAIDTLYHPDQDMLVTYIMGILNQGLREMYADDIKGDWGLHPTNDKLDLGQGTLFANVYKYVAETVNLAPVPEVYLKQDQALGVRNANVHPPGIVAGADVVQNTDAKELAFRIAKLLGGMRSEHYLGSIGWPTEVLKMFFMAAMHVTNQNLGLQQQLGEQGMTVAQEIQNMPSQMQMQLQKHVSQYLKTGQNPNLSKWLRHVEHTINRIGMLLCGDLQVAAKCIKADRNTISKASVKEKIRELVLFVISDDFTELRERLGLAIG